MDTENIDETALTGTVLRTMVEFSGVGLFETTLTGHIRYANEPLARMLGYPDRSALFADNRTAGSFYVDPQDQARIRAAVQADGRVDGVICALRRQDGRQIWVSEHGTALRDERGAVTGYVGSLADVTELVETQMRLAQAEADYRRIFERATEGIYRSSLDGKQLRSNPALYRLNGYASEAEHLASVTDIATEWYVDPGRRAEFKRLLDLHGHVEDFESEIYAHKSRRRLWISENAYLVRDAEGAPLFYEGTVRDISERKRSERAMRRALEEAESASRAKTVFFASVSHELRTPLNAILGFSELILSNGQADTVPPAVLGYARHIHDAGRHLLDLINDILDLARIEAGARTLEPEVLDAAAVLSDAVDTVQPLSAAKALALHRPKADGLRLRADRRAVHQCLLNVLSNAIKFSAHAGDIHLRCGRRDGLGFITVADRGSGMPPDVIARVGEPFLTDGSQTPDSVRGSGLGLAITQSLLAQMGGRLEITSEPGRSTTVTLLIPEAT